MQFSSCHFIQYLTATISKRVDWTSHVMGFSRFSLSNHYIPYNFIQVHNLHRLQYATTTFCRSWWTFMYQSLRIGLYLTGHFGIYTILQLNLHNSLIHTTLLPSRPLQVCLVDVNAKWYINRCIKTDISSNHLIFSTKWSSKCNFIMCTSNVHTEKSTILWNSHISTPNTLNSLLIGPVLHLLDVTLRINELNITYTLIIFGDFEYRLTRFMSPNLISNIGLTSR